MCVTKQCASLDKSTSQRCTRQVYESSKHCDVHYKKAQRLYLHYKKLCESANNLDINKPITNRRKKIAHLRRCHNLLAKAYNARLQHRNYAFAPECYDFGHNLQFQIIQEKIDRCSDELYALTSKAIGTKSWKSSVDVINDDKNRHMPLICLLENELTDDKQDLIDTRNISETKDIKESYNNKDIKESKDIEVEDEEVNEYKQAIKLMREFEIKRRQDEKATERAVELYISENKTYLDKKRKAVNAIVKVLNILSESSELYINRNIYHLVKHLILIDYLDDDYKPTECKECKCGDFKIYNFQLARKLKPSYPSTASMFDHLCICQVIVLYDLMLSNLKKIKPIAKEVVGLFKIYDNDISIMDLQLNWNRDLRRLVLSESDIKVNGGKMSRRMALQRKRRKTFGEFIRMLER